MKVLVRLTFLVLSVLVYSYQATKTGPDWWKSSVIYQIYPRSFKDSDNDGIGDLQGIISKIDYFVELGVDAIWLSPIYKSPMVDAGYDISDYRSIAPEYGNLSDFKELLEAAHKNGLKLILDFVPNHTSNLHEWFNKSVAREEGYEDYYLWNDGYVDDDGVRQPPNNWLSLWSFSGWEWNEQRQQYYFHQFSIQQPDLNYRSEKVRQEMKDILTYWLDIGVDGFRVDAVPHIYEDELLRDEPIVPDSGVDDTNWNYLNHIYTKDQPETFELVYSWRTHLDNYTNTVGGDTRMFMTECSSDMENLVKYYGNENGTVLGAHFTFNFYFLGINENTTAADLQSDITVWYQNLPSIYTFNWLTGNHDNHRVASKVGQSRVDAYNMLISFLDGVTITYMAEEIGQENGEVTCEQGQDPSAIKNCTTFNETTRDFERTPFQWDNSTNAGFNEGAPTWLPVSSKYLETNLQEERLASRSHYHVYTDLVQLKASLSAYNSSYIFVNSLLNNRLLEVQKALDDPHQSTYRLYFNTGNEALTVSLDQNYTVVIPSVNLAYTQGLTDNDLVLNSGDSVIIKVL
ncbi:maltase 1-like [Sitophilus oryzae]|uniref:alpha-glucosidase n=1 Tax=Sitophilus oryzae TaxID=7048 RepID=A0A6J2YKU1_SITOR|nr:maltase 1-like [Sitophilus oryzae]